MFNILCCPYFDTMTHLLYGPQVLGKWPTESALDATQSLPRPFKWRSIIHSKLRILTAIRLDRYHQPQAWLRQQVWLFSKIDCLRVCFEKNATHKHLRSQWDKRPWIYPLIHVPLACNLSFFLNGAQTWNYVVNQEKLTKSIPDHSWHYTVHVGP